MVETRSVSSISPRSTEINRIRPEGRGYSRPRTEGIRGPRPGGYPRASAYWPRSASTRTASGLWPPTVLISSESRPSRDEDVVQAACRVLYYLYTSYLGLKDLAGGPQLTEDRGR